MLQINQNGFVESWCVIIRKYTVHFPKPRQHVAQLTSYRPSAMMTSQQLKRSWFVDNYKCCRFAVDLSVLNHIKRICWRLAGDTTDLSTTSRHVEMLQTNPLVAKCCRFAVDLLATQRICWRYAVETVSQQAYSKSPANPCSIFWA